ncbi:MAG: S-layer homology domain-containing protein, partial [Clostridiales bacterium]|nr:S-layer homology domain-containing protein [Clostridiales bacterium]
VVKWDDIEQFPPGQGVLPPERAQALYRERLGVSPRYCDDDGGNPVLLYGANVTERTYINAFTGELTPTGIKNGGFATDISNAEKYMTVTDPTASGRDAEGAPPYERLADGVRSRLGIGEAYALGPAFSGAGYHSLTFVSRRDGIIEVVLDSETRDVLRYFKSHPADVTEQVSEAAAYEAARDFARRAAPVKYASCAGDGGTWYDAESYTITFPRVVNGIAYLDNGITVAGNAASGEVLSFTLQWTQSLFPSAANAAGEEAACDELFRRVGLELQYVAVAKRGVTRPRSVRDIELRLVYHFVPGKPLFVNAVTGRLSDARGNAYAGDLPSRYADVAGHPSEAYINALAPCGILSAGENFHPDDAITQAEYLTWLYRAVRQYDVTADELYNALIYGFRVIREEERNDDAPLVFRDAVKYLIRLLGYTDVAELEDTYQTGFVDEAAITPEYIGYAAIAKGLHIVKGNAFAPERRVTRATAAEIIYNLLTN